MPAGSDDDPRRPSAATVTPFAVSSWRVAPSCILLACSGELDASTAPTLRDAFGQRTEPRVIVDLTAIDFMDSTGLSILLNARRRHLRAGRRMVVLCPDGPARRIMRLACLEGTLCVVDSLGAAIDRLRGPSLVA
jgi:anti-sigma B factor antagonist